MWRVRWASTRSSPSCRTSSAGIPSGGRPGGPQQTTPSRSGRGRPARNSRYASAREVRQLLTKDGVVVGYSGLQPEPHGASPWVERRRQVWQDIRKGSCYFVVHDGHEIHLQCDGHERVSARLPNGRDTLVDLPEATNGGLDMGLLTMVEDYPDLFLQMRRPPSLSRASS